jgi:multisubunit Na+/H+ antiporter MnhC subunit
MEIGLTTGALMASGVLLAASPSYDLQLSGFCLAGAAIGGFIAAAGWREKEQQPVTARRFLVNAGCGLVFGMPFTRMVCAQLEIDPGPEEALCGGAVMGIFGVVLLDLGPSTLTEWIKKRSNN